jgi:hypothetical protein
MYGQSFEKDDLEKDSLSYRSGTLSCWRFTEELIKLELFLRIQAQNTLSRYLFREIDWKNSFQIKLQQAYSEKFP